MQPDPTPKPPTRHIDSPVGTPPRASSAGPPPVPPQPRKRPAHPTKPADGASSESASEATTKKKKKKHQVGHNSPNSAARVSFDLNPNILGPPPAPFPRPALPSPALDRQPKAESASPDKASLFARPAQNGARIDSAGVAASIISNAQLLLQDNVALRAQLEEASEKLEIAGQVLEQVVEAEKEAKEELNGRIEELKGEKEAAEVERREVEEAGRARVAELEEEVRVARAEVDEVRKKKESMLDGLREMVAKNEGA